MSGKPISIIFALAMLCVPAAAVYVSSVTTVQNGYTYTASETTVNKGTTYTVNLNTNPSTGYKWTITHSKGLKLLSDKLTPSSTGSGENRELKFLADQTGKQTITAECRKSGEEKPEQTSEFVLDVI